MTEENEQVNVEVADMNNNQGNDNGGGNDGDDAEGCFGSDHADPTGMAFADSLYTAGIVLPVLKLSKNPCHNRTILCQLFFVLFLNAFLQGYLAVKLSRNMQQDAERDYELGMDAFLFQDPVTQDFNIDASEGAVNPCLERPDTAVGKQCYCETQSKRTTCEKGQYCVKGECVADKLVIKENDCGFDEKFNGFCFMKTPTKNVAPTGTATASTTVPDLSSKESGVCECFGVMASLDAKTGKYSTTEFERFTCWRYYPNVNYNAESAFCEKQGLTDADRPHVCDPRDWKLNFEKYRATDKGKYELRATTDDGRKTSALARCELSNYTSNIGKCGGWQTGPMVRWSMLLLYLAYILADFFQTVGYAKVMYTMIGCPCPGLMNTEGVDENGKCDEDRFINKDEHVQLFNEDSEEINKDNRKDHEAQMVIARSIRESGFLYRLYVWLFILAPKFVVAFFLSIYGGGFVLTATAEADLILNALALVFVTDIDEFGFYFFLSQEQQDKTMDVPQFGVRDEGLSYTDCINRRYGIIAKTVILFVWWYIVLEGYCSNPPDPSMSTPQGF